MAVDSKKDLDGYDSNSTLTEDVVDCRLDTDGMGLTPLFDVVYNGNYELTCELLEDGAKHQASKIGGFTALHYAAMLPNRSLMSCLLNKNGPDFEAFYEHPDYSSLTQPSSNKIFEQRAAIVRMLLKCGANMNVCSEGFTPLKIAAATAQDSIVNALLDKGASAEGVTVICAHWGLRSDTVKRLLERGANLEATDMRWNKTALTWLAEIGSLSTLRVLLQHTANVDHQDVQGSLALHYASANARTEFVKLLLESGANPNVQDNEGKTPLTRLASPPNRWFYLAGHLWKPTPSDREDSAILLIRAGCDPFVKDRYGKSAIHYGARNGYLGVLKVIVNQQGNWEVPDEYGRTPLDYAREGVHTDIVKFLEGKSGAAE